VFGGRTEIWTCSLGLTPLCSLCLHWAISQLTWGKSLNCRVDQAREYIPIQAPFPSAPPLPFSPHPFQILVQEYNGAGGLWLGPQETEVTFHHPVQVLALDRHWGCAPTSMLVPSPCVLELCLWPATQMPTDSLWKTEKNPRSGKDGGPGVPVGSSRPWIWLALQGQGTSVGSLTNKFGSLLQKKTG
jgi:hypothetical protein